MTLILVTKKLQPDSIRDTPIQLRYWIKVFTTNSKNNAAFFRWSKMSIQKNQNLTWVSYIHACFFLFKSIKWKLQGKWGKVKTFQNIFIVTFPVMSVLISHRPPCRSLYGIRKFLIHSEYSEVVMLAVQVSRYNTLLSQSFFLTCTTKKHQKYRSITAPAFDLGVFWFDTLKMEHSCYIGY